MNLSTRRTSQDPLVKALLATHKFNLLSVPRAGADIYDLYIGKGRDILPPSRLQSLYTKPIELPLAKRDEAFEAPEKVYSRALSIGIVTKLTGKLFSAHGATLLDSKMDAAFKKAGASSAEIRFNDVVRDSLDPVEVHRKISKRSIEKDGLSLVKGRDLYLVVGVVRAMGIEIRAKIEGSTDIRANVDVKQMVQGESSIVVENKESGSLVFRGTKRIAFGVELVELRLNRDTGALGVGRLPPAIDIRRKKGLPVDFAFIGNPDGALFVDLPSPSDF
jgi:hypothetical protein